MINKKISTALPYLSNIIHNTYAKSYNIIHDEFYGMIKVPQKWVEDIKHLEFNEILASSIGPLALYFGWKNMFWNLLLVLDCFQTLV